MADKQNVSDDEVAVRDLIEAWAAAVRRKDYAGILQSHSPDLVMFDEPSLGLAPTVVHDVLATIRDLNRDGLTCLLVEQNVAVSLKLASRGYVLENGRITHAGSGAELLADDRVRQAYLGM